MRTVVAWAYAISVLDGKHNNKIIFIDDAGSKFNKQPCHNVQAMELQINTTSLSTFYYWSKVAAAGHVHNVTSGYWSTSTRKATGQSLLVFTRPR